MAASRRDKGLASARRHAEAGKFDDALRELQRVLEANPSDTEACVVLGDVYMQAHQGADAVKAYVQAALALSEGGRLDEAIALFREKVIPSQPTSVNAWLRLGELYRRKGMIQEALGEYRASARIFEQRGEDEDAGRVLSHILKMAPNDVASRVGLAEVYSRMDDPEAPAGELAIAGDFLRQANRLNEYLRVSERLLHLQPGNMLVLRDVVRLCLEIGRPHKALARVQRRLQQQENDLDALEMLVQTFDELHEPRKAANVLKQLARIHDDAGRGRQRDGALRRVLERMPDAAAVARALEGSGAGTANDDEKTARRDAPSPDGEGSVVFELSMADIEEFREITPDPDGVVPASEPSGPSLMGPTERARGMAEVAIYLKHGRSSRARKSLQWILAADPAYSPAKEQLEALSPAPGVDEEERVATEELEAGELELVDSSSEATAIFEVLSDVGYLWDHSLFDEAQEVIARAVERLPDAMLLRERQLSMKDLRQGMEETQEVELLDIPVDQLLAPVFVRPQTVADGSEMDGQAHFDLGITYREMGLVDQAPDAFGIALEASVRRAASHRLIGLCHREKGDLEGAADCFRRGLGIRDGGDVAAASLHFEMAEIEVAQGNKEAAADEYEAVRGLDPRYPGLAERLRALGTWA